MRFGSRFANPVLFLGGIAGVDLAARVVLDLLYVGDPIAIVIPIGALATRYVLGAAAIQQLLGWMLLGGAMFVVAPEVFPEELLAWARGIPGRAVLTLATVTAALFFNSALATLEVFGPSPIEPPMEMALISLVAVFVLIPVTRWKAQSRRQQRGSRCPGHAGPRTSWPGRSLPALVPRERGRLPVPRRSPLAYTAVVERIPGTKPVHTIRRSRTGPPEGA